MKRIAVLSLMLAVAVTCSAPLRAQESTTSKSQGQSEKAIQKQQLALYKYQKQQEKAQATAEKTPTVDFGKKGLKITSPDKNYELSLKGYAQLDMRNFFNDQNKTNRSEFLARRLQPALEGKAGNVEIADYH